VCVLAALCAAPLTAGGHRERAEYVGGTVAELSNSSGGFIDLTGDRCFRFETRSVVVEVPYDSINVLEYGQKADRRYILALTVSPLLLLSKKRTHFLTVGYEDDRGRQQALVFRVDKSDIRTVLASLEARTGRKVEYQDPEARKRGKG
jgi:hypothetical protein